MDPLQEPVHHTGKPPKRPLVVGAIAGGLIGAVIGLLITLLNLAGKGDWTLAVPGAVFDGVCLGVIVGAIIRETKAEKGKRVAKQNRFRPILLWAALGVVLLLVGKIIFFQS